MKKLLAIFVLFASLKSYGNCLTEAETARDMHSCLTTELHTEEQVMQRALDMAYESAAELTAEIRRSQVDWMRYKDSHCEVIRQRYTQGDVGIIAHPLCVLDMTQLRIEELKTVIGY